MNKYLMEFIGTFFLVLTIGLTSIAPSIGLFAPLAIGAVLIVMVYTGGPISGAHYNPAVTLGIYLSKKCPLNNVPFYLLAQLLGAVLAAYCVILIKGSVGSTAPIEVLPTFLAEFLFTFALVFVILNVAFSNRSKGNAYYGIAIGLTVLGGAYAVGSISGASFNPAVTIGLIIMKLSHLSTIGIYLGSQCLGGILAWKTFQIIESK
jgi:aquaporin Z